MSQITELATSQINASSTIVVELVEADEPRPSSSCAGRTKRPSSIPSASRMQQLRLRSCLLRRTPSWPRSRQGAGSRADSTEPPAPDARRGFTVAGTRSDRTSRGWRPIGLTYHLGGITLGPTGRANTSRAQTRPCQIRGSCQTPACALSRASDNNNHRRATPARLDARRGPHRLADLLLRLLDQGRQTFERRT